MKFSDRANRETWSRQRAVQDKSNRNKDENENNLKADFKVADFHDPYLKKMKDRSSNDAR